MVDEFETVFAGQDVVDQVLNDFQDSWRRNEPPSLTGFLRRIQDQPGSVRETLRIRLVQLDQAVRWQLWRKQTDALVRTVEGFSKATDHLVIRRAPLLEDYARNCPEIGTIDSLPLELVVHEYQLRVEFRDDPKLEEYEQRFPQFASTLSIAILAMLVESDTAVTGPDGMTLSEPAYLKRAGTKTSSNEMTESMQPSEMPRRNRRVERPVPAGRQFGQYELLYELARGGMGVVYKARDVEIDRPVALKMILAGKLASPRDIQLFQEEAKSAGNLKHENIVPIYGAGEIRGKHFIAMAFIEGQSLLDLVREKPLAPKRAAEIVELVARALHYAHIQPRPVYHRDIKPANILMDTSGKPYVTDFGIAKRVEGKDSKAFHNNLPLGTPSYMPSEQAKCLTAEIGPWSDVYSTGAVLYHLLTGKPPFLADTITETLRQVEQEDAVSPRQLNHQVDADLEAVCLMCLEKDWHKRYQSAQELADDLRRFLNHEPTEARPLSSLGRLARWCRRNTVVAALTMTTALLLIAFSVAVSVAYVGASKDKEDALKAKSEALTQKGIADQAKEQADHEAKKARAAEATANKALVAETDAKKKAIDAENKAKDALLAETAATMKAVNEETRAKLALAAEKEAKSKADAAQNEAVSAKRSAELARDLARENLKHAINTVDKLLTFTADEGLKDLPGGEGIRKGLAQEALRRLKPILDENPKDRSSRLALAKVKHVQARLLEITQSAEVDDVFQKAIELFAALLDSLRDDSKPDDPNPIDVIVELTATYRDYGDSLTDRSLRDRAQEKPLLNRALEQYKRATDLLAKSDASDLRLVFEEARILISRSISRTYLKETKAALDDVRQASQLFEELLEKLTDPDTQRKTQRLLASSLRTIVHEEYVLTPEPPQVKLQGWFSQLDRAQKFQEELFQQNNASIELRFDIALTRFEKAYLLATKAARYDEALLELKEARESFSKLADGFAENPKYELHRILTLVLSASILAGQSKFPEAAQEVKDADEAVRKYNVIHSTAKREDVQLRIADLAKRIGEALQKKK